MKIAVVIQRYGEEVLGGAERLALQVVNLLKNDYEIDVLTTTAKDYITWANHYSEGRDSVDGVDVFRFPVKRERIKDDFDSLSERLFIRKENTSEDEDEWFQRQGPLAPELISYIAEEYQKYSCFIFFTYLYFPTVYGLPIVADRSLLVPTAHDEPPFYLERVARLFRLTKGLVFNTAQEKAFVYNTYPFATKNCAVAGTYISKPSKSAGKKRPLKNRYILYFGRFDRGKGLYELFDYFHLLRSYYPNLSLVCLGSGGVDINPRYGIEFPGFVSEAKKWNYIDNSEFVVIPSALESLSITMLEGMAGERPVLVNGKSDVMKEHCRKSGAGMWYNDHHEFVEAAFTLLNNPEKGAKMGKLGLEYVKKNYSPEHVYRSYKKIIQSVAG